MVEQKRKRGRPKKEQTQRVTTFKPNGPAESMQVAPNAVDIINEIDLGPVVLPEPEQAVQVLRVLAELNDRVLQAHARLVEQQTKTKAAKGKWEELAAELQTKLRAATHGSDLPLFDATEREQDLKALEVAAEQARAGVGTTPEISKALDASLSGSASDVF